MTKSHFLAKSKEQINPWIYQGATLASCLRKRISGRNKDLPILSSSYQGRLNGLLRIFYTRWVFPSAWEALHVNVWEHYEKRNAIPGKRHLKGVVVVGCKLNIRIFELSMHTCSVCAATDPNLCKGVSSFERTQSFLGLVTNRG